MPDVSVVIPTYNRKEYLRKAIASCFEGNEDVDVEVVVVDDGSTDGTRECLEDLDDDRVRPIFQGHQSGQVARNRGLQEARGVYVKFLDDDDWLASGTLQEEVAILQEEEADMCTGGCLFVDQDENPLGAPDFPMFEDLLVACFEGTVGPHPLRHAYRTSFVRELRWDEDLPCRQDYGFVLTVALEGPDHAHSNVMTGYKRQHEEGLSETAESQKKATMVHLRLLQEAAQSLEEEQKEARKAAAKGLWEWGRVNAVRDWTVFQETIHLIQEIDPGFTPSRGLRLLSLADRLWGSKTTELLTLPVRKLKSVVQAR